VAPAQPCHQRELVRASRGSNDAPAWTPNTLRREFVVWPATVRLSESAPVSVKPAWARGRALQARERRDEGLPRPAERDLVAGLELAEELVGPGLSDRGARARPAIAIGRIIWLSPCA
jgi:hypothetical protein